MKLTDLQLEKLADILIIVGQVIFVSAVVPFFVDIDKPASPMVLSGWSLSIACWAGGLILVGRVKR